MKIVLVIMSSILFPFLAIGQIISTVAGNGTNTNTGDGGVASLATINFPAASIFDKENNLFFCTGFNGRTIRKISASGIISTFAGTTGVSGSTGDGGLASLATFINPQGVTLDSSGNLYVADAGGNRIRRIDKVTGFISTYAGNGIQGYSGDGGLATAAQLYGPGGICFDRKGNLYIADYGNLRIRKVDRNGIISTFAGTGVAGFSGDGGLAAEAMIRGAFDVCSDKWGNIYIADEANHRIRKVDTFGIINTIAGTGVSGNTGDGGPALSADIIPHDVSCDRYGNLYMCDIYNHVIRVVKVSGVVERLAGTGTSGFSGDGSVALSASLYGPHKISFDTCVNVYFSDLDNYRIRKITYPSCHYLSVNNTEAPTSISFFPNPTTDAISINNAPTGAVYAVVNTIGAVLQQGSLRQGSNSVSIGHLPAGVYQLHITNGAGERMVHKIVKQ